MTKSTANILDGKKLSAKYLKECSQELSRLKSRRVRLTLATLQAGKAKDTELYFNYLKKLIGSVGVQLASFIFPPEVPESVLIKEIRRLNRDSSVTGIMVFSPLPKSCAPANLFDHLSKLKDVEGRTFLKSHFGVFSPTANAVLSLIESAGVDLKGKEAVVVGHSDLVGKPTAVLLMDKLATVVVCHKETRDLKMHVERADILVSAAGIPRLIKGSWIKPGAVVIDVGENMVDGKIVGDVEFETARSRASFITPVPGGVGPVTNVMLIKNLIL
jgi:methylenetetrahydrofolate dehydrogenase (NADP+)/methenyltetrahydrofolate cyclohydrolase